MDQNRTDYKHLALRLIEEQHTMTLATAGAQGPWAAPVYYIFLEGAFYFFSSPDSRHIEESLDGRRASAAIFAHGFSWQNIRGLQMSGAVTAIPPGPAALRIIRAYLEKFPFTRDFFKPSELLDLNAFTNRFRVKLYRFEPDLVYYLDNTIRFGFRERVSLED